MLSSLKKTAKKYTRRVLQGVHQSKDGNQQSEKEFAQMVARFDDIEKNLRQFYDHIQAYVSALRDSCTLQANISGDLLYFFDAKSNNRVHADKYHTICTKMHVTRWTELSRSLQESVLDPLKEHLELFPTVKEMVKKRKRKLTDVQSYRRQVLSLAKTAKTKNPEKFKKKQEKLSQAEAIFQRIHGDLVEVLDSYDKSREDLLVGYTWKIMHAQRTFLQNSHQDTIPLKATSEVFKKTAKEKTRQVVDRLSELVELFKGGEYASDYANLPSTSNFTDVEGSNSGETSRSRGASPARKSPKSKQASKFKEDLQCYLNPPFDTNLAFELRHRMYAPNDTQYLASKEDEAVVFGLKPDIIEVKYPTKSELFHQEVVDREEAVYSFKSSMIGELSFSAGDEIEVLERRESGWWIGRLKNGESGSFPCNYTRPIIMESQ
ncbi:hypothetical protein AAMO2058_000378100 [Amorphochlora amoebiformis]